MAGGACGAEKEVGGSRMSEGKKYGYSVSDLTEFDIAVHHAVCDAVTIRENCKEKMIIPADDIWILMGHLSEPLTSQMNTKLAESVRKLWCTAVEVRDSSGNHAIEAQLLMGSTIRRRTGELVSLNLVDEPVLHALRKVVKAYDIHPVYRLQDREYGVFVQQYWHAPKNSLYDYDPWEDYFFMEESDD